MANKYVPKGPKAHNKIAKVMTEFRTGSLHSGNKKGPKVSSRQQAIAIALSEARKAEKGKRKKKRSKK